MAPQPALRRGQRAGASFAALESFALQHPTFQTQRVVPSQGLPEIEVPARTAQSVRDLWQRVAHGYSRPLTAAGRRA